MKRKLKQPNMDFYIKYTKSKVPKGVIKTKKEKELKSNEWLKGVSCFVLNQDGNVLIEQRANKGLTPGKLDLCSGHIDNVEIPFQSMVRELKEELGIDIQKESKSKLYQLTPKNVPLVFESNGKQKNFFITFFCLKRDSSEVVIQKSEVDNIKYINLEKAFELIKSGKTKFPAGSDYEPIFNQVRNIKEMEKNIQHNFGGR